jgi:hypothetical protein
MWIFVTRLNANRMKLANLRQRTLCNHLCFRRMEISPTRRRHTLTIHCDHKNLTYYQTPQRLTARQARWWTNLSRYNYQLIHIPGAKLIQADALSRRPDHTKGEEDHKLVTMLPKEQFISLIATDLRDQIQTLSSNDDFIKGIIKCLKERSTPPLRTALSDLDPG